MQPQYSLVWKLSFIQALAGHWCLQSLQDAVYQLTYCEQSKTEITGAKVIHHNLL